MRCVYEVSCKHCETPREPESAPCCDGAELDTVREELAATKAKLRDREARLRALAPFLVEFGMTELPKRALNLKNKNWRRS